MRICTRYTTVTEQRVAEGVTVGGCHGCGGVWFDRGELDAVTRRDPAALFQTDQTFQPARSELTPPYFSTRCPVCLERLERFEFKHFAGISLDGCKKCRGVWAEHGELTQIANRIMRAR